MNALAPARRWLAAAALGLGLLAPGAAQAIVASPQAEPRLELERARDIDRPILFFNKTGRQLDCRYVEYRITFGIKTSAPFFSNPDVAAMLAATRFDLSDQLPAGLKAVSTSLFGDVTGGGGGVAPAIGTTVNPGDTVSVGDFRLTAADLNGDGSPDTRLLELRIVAEINAAAFPAPAIVANQAKLKITSGGRFTDEALSHDPALPDDGNWMTGDPTRIGINLQRCEPPHHGGEPCFKVDSGKIDCSLTGDGSFIYHMSVGPEMAGQTVELQSLTPGVTITPASQIVPPGGGELLWTISGASPGMVVKLVVTGVKTVGAPGPDGMGLCCTQEIEITIPPNIDCPRPKLPDIKVEKRADVTECSISGGCAFTIRVTNVGEGPYNGPIVINDVTGPGNATLQGPPNAPWVCAPGTSPITCTHPATTLNPGQWVELKVSFVPGPGWNVRGIRNCAAYDYEKSGKTPFGRQDNDRFCATIPICIPGTPNCDRPQRPPDLEIRKIAYPSTCSPAGVCKFFIGILNNGPTYNGPLSVADEFPFGAVTSATFSPTPPWVCGLDGAPNRYRCDAASVSLVHGAWAVIEVNVVATGYNAPSVRNCARVLPIPGETNLGNNQACADARIPERPQDRPTLRILKTCAPGLLGGEVKCTITVTNPGTVTPTGTIGVGDAATLVGGGTPVQIQSVTTDGAGWTCGPTPANTLFCNLPGSQLPPGATRSFTVAVAVQPNQRFRNCATGRLGGEGGPEFGQACAEGGTSIAIRKTGSAQCVRGEPCAFTIGVTNTGSAPFSGPVLIGDGITTPGFSPVPVSSIVPPLGCAPEPTQLPFACNTNLSLAPGETKQWTVTVVLPPLPPATNVPGPSTATNCAVVASPDIRRSGRLLIDPAPQGSAMVAPMAAVALPPGYDCFTFTVAQKLQACATGLVLNAAGQCACPDGQTFRNGRCVGQGTTPPPPPPPPPTVCPAGTGLVPGAGGQCVCPSGTNWNGQSCQKPPTNTCTGGRVINPTNGQCVCPQGTWDGQRCITQPVCTGGRVVNPLNGQCVCPQGTWNGQACVQQPVCTGGRIPVIGGTGCVCPLGQTWNGQQCQTPQACTGGRIPVPGTTRCVCPTGTTWNGQQCTQPPACTGGRTLDSNGRCSCPGKLVWNGQQCNLPTITLPPKITTVPPVIACTGGRTMNAAGQCVCPTGSNWDGRTCVKTPVLNNPGILIPKLQQVIPR